ncbi:Autophagy-related protein 16-2 [Galemys pyrenaicus]|uniref:Autophagy-related protein 16-2 n=1 Tax=Galemys pyrenaicus TaxID=202257 RepID=A0A8J6DW42_GALPY|nr:Autophagy-related protein 16-2 [Galemys pyrenaicus]
MRLAPGAARRPKVDAVGLDSAPPPSALVVVAALPRPRLAAPSSLCPRETAAMAGPGAVDTPATLWKRHIVRQLRQRDRTQKALFLELVPAYNRLLEKAELLTRVSEKLQPEPSDVTAHQSPWEELGLDSGQVPSPATLKAKWQGEEEGLRLLCGEVCWTGV